MKSIEELVSIFGGIPTAQGSSWSVETVVPKRLHVSRGERGEFTLFLEGPVSSFGEIPAWSAIAHSDAVHALPSGRTISALRISTQDAINGNRAISHVAYELARRLEAAPEASNKDLLGSVLWILPLLGGSDVLLTGERQYGLLGECVLLLRLLALASTLGLDGREALYRWKGAGASKRDFAAQDVAIEVKTTSQVTRLHHFSSIEQLDPQSATEEVFLFSLGAGLLPVSGVTE